MKKVLSIIVALALLVMTASVAVFAESELGSYDNPYYVNAGSLTPTGVNVPAGGEAYVFVDDSNNSTLTIGYATGAGYQVYYCRQPILPEADGTLTFTMLNGADYFCIVNPTEADIVVRMMLEAGSGSANVGTVDSPENLPLSTNMFGGIGADAERALAAGNQGYYFTVTAPGAGIISVSVSAWDDEYNNLDWIYFVNNITSGRYGDNHYSDEEEPVYYEEIKASEGDEIQIFVATYDPASPWSAPAGNVNVSVSFDPVGSYNYPEEITAGSYTASLTAGNFFGYNYSWTATESGTATITMDTASGWMYNVSGITADEEYFYFGEYHWFDDDPAVPSESVAVNAGDTLSIMVNTYDSNSGMSVDGDIDWTFTFVPGEGNNDGGNEGDDSGDLGDDTEIVEINWELSDLLIALGTDSYTVSNMYPYTLYSFEPTETGKYIFSSDDALIGLASNNGMWITAGSSTEAITDGVVAGNTFEWTCTSVGQSIWVAALADTNVATITVDYEEVVIKEIPRVYYENVVTPEAFVFDGDADALEYVDTFDGIEDTAVLGEDGYYHLNAADGPILFANINDPMMSLATANSYGQLKQLIYEGEEIVQIVDYTMAMIDYIAAMDQNNGLYPLTADLVEVFSKAGSSLGWYGAEGWLGGEEADAWMFACYYSEDITGEADIPTPDNNDENNGESDNNDADNNDADNNVIVDGGNAPQTGDNMMFVAITAVVALVSFAGLLVIRRRRAN